MTVTVQRTVSMGHRLPSYRGACSSPHGHNVRVVAVVETHGEFADFKHVDARLAEVLADLDHAMVLQEADPLLPVLRGFGFRTVALSVDPTTEALAQLVLNELRASEWDAVSVTVHETDKYSATAAVEDPEVRRCATR